jgi:hypothetical protein
MVAGEISFSRLRLDLAWRELRRDEGTIARPWRLPRRTPNSGELRAASLARLRRDQGRPTEARAISWRRSTAASPKALPHPI